MVCGTFRLLDEVIDQARPAMARVIAASRAEVGCLSYAYAFDLLEPGLVRVSETWLDHDALTRHFDMPHMQTWRREREELGLTDRDMRAFITGEGEVL